MQVDFREDILCDQFCDSDLELKEDGNKAPSLLRTKSPSFWD